MKPNKAITRARPEASERSGNRTDAPSLLALLAAADDIFLAKGYHSATMNDVAKAAGMSKKTVYTLIESKPELLAALLAHYQSKLQLPILEPNCTIHEALIANLNCLSQFVLSPSQIAILRLIMTEYTHSLKFVRLFHLSRIKKAKSKLESCLAEFAAQKSQSATEAKEMAAMLFGMAVGNFQIGVLVGFRSVPTKPELQKRVREAVNIFLAGYWIA